MTSETRSRSHHGRSLEPHRIGVVIDLPDTLELVDGLIDGIRFGLEEAYERGVVERPVEVIRRDGRAQPWTDARPLLSAHRRLVEDDGVLGVIGPFTSDNALALLPQVEALGVPTCALAGSPSFVGRAAFSLPNGGLADEPPVMAAWLAGQDLRRLAVLRETTRIGEEYTTFFRYAARTAGLDVVAEAAVYPVVSESELAERLQRLQDAKPDALVYLGLGAINAVMRPALEEIGWDPPRIQTTAFVTAAYSADRARRLEGWVGVDQYDERNRVLAAVLDRYRALGRPVQLHSGFTCGYDAGHAFGVALGRMPIATPAGLITGLETVRRLPACSGGPGTVITFGPEDHRGFKGPDFLILRRAEGGTTQLVGSAPVDPWPQP